MQTTDNEVETRAPIMMVDARNCMYRAIYAGKRSDSKRHYFVIMLRMIASWINQYHPGIVQIFWDAPRSTVWRRQIMSNYKDRDYNNYIADISEDLVLTERVAKETFKVLNVYQFQKNRMEADDLIYAACRHQCDRPMVIFSSDSDMQQIPFAMRYVRVFNPEKRTEIPTAQCSPVMMKALAGDNADRINGYQGIGPKTSEKLIKSPSQLQEHLDKAGRTTFIRNMLLIDMGLCPYLLENQLYVARTLSTKPIFDKQKLLELEKSLKINGITPEYSEIVVPFKLIPNE